ncbi:MAG: hypothetical protein ACREQK_10915 [Candidatus Binatia bacterium]
MEPRKKNRKRRGQRVQDSSFMDTVRAAFIRWLALEKWRELDDLRTTLGMELEQAIEDAGRFPNRGRYERLWIERWKAEVRLEIAGADAGAIFGAIEKAVAAAVEEETAERKANGDPPLEEDSEYKTFVDSALERLLRAGDVGASS